MSNEENMNPYEKSWEEIMDYCYECCHDELAGCAPDEMCPGCDCQSVCGDYEDDEDVYDIGYYDEHEDDELLYDLNEE
ncbi:MAG: hypothetical protein LM558_00175 [Thermosphaera sp.]|nr:hypothetical protein [Thermosphaera sp.]